MKKILALLSIIFLNLSLAAQTCGNIGFEEGTSNGWTCRSGTYGSVNPPTCGPDDGPTILGSTGCINNSGNNAPTQSVNDRHVIMSQAGTDPNSNNTVSYVAPANLFPSGTNLYSFRLGNGNAGGTGGNPNLSMAESIEYTMLVTPQNAGLTYMYAVFLMDPSHQAWESPRFEIRITRKVGGIDSLIDCGKYKVIAGVGTGSWNDGPVGTEWKYTDWTRVGLDLTGFIGQNITIQFITSDCFPTKDNNAGCNPNAGSHSSYAYIDLYCAPLQIDAPVICASTSSIQACAPPGYATYSWPAGQPGIAGSPTTQCVTINNPQPGTTYTVNMTSVAGGCPTSTTVTLKGINFTTTDTTVCAGSPGFQLNPVPITSGAYTFSWSPAIDLSCSNCQHPIFTPVTTRTYTVTMKDTSLASCLVSKTLTINVNPQPIITVANSSICKGLQTTLVASGADTYTWSPATGLNTTIGSTVNSSPSIDQVYTITGTSSAGCTGTNTVSVTVKNCLVLTTKDTTVCLGQCGILDATASSGTPPYTYTWSNGNNQLDTICPTSTTIYTVTASDVNGNTASGMLTIFVNPLPIIAVNPVSVCNGLCATLNAQGAKSYTWTPSTGLNTSIGSVVKACNLPSNQTYTVTGTSVLGCTNTTSVTVTIMALPTLASAPATICSGNSTAVSVSGANTYTWTPTVGLNASTGNNLTANPLVTTTYSISGKDVNGCFNTTTVKVTVNPLPTIVSTGKSICQGMTTTLTTGGANTYTWNPANTLNTSSGPIVIAQPGTTTNYTISGTDINGCTGTVQTTVWISPLPTLTTSNVSLCKGTSTTVTVNGAANYIWTPTTGINPTTGASVTATPSLTTTYTIVGTTTFGCTSSTIVTVVVHNIPMIKAYGDTICARETAEIKATGGSLYTWNPGNYSDSLVKVTLTQNTTYTVTGFDANGCSHSATTSVMVKALPVADFTPDPSTVSIDEPTIYFHNQSTNAQTFKWKFGDGEEDSSTFNTQHKYENVGTYNVCLQVQNQGCFHEICKDIVVLPEWSFYVPDAFSPNGDGLNDGFIGVGINILQYEMWIFDRWGNMIYHCKDMNKPWNGRRNNNLDLQVAQEDVYVWKIKIEDIFNKKHAYIGHVTLVK